MNQAEKNAGWILLGALGLVAAGASLQMPLPLGPGAISFGAASAAVGLVYACIPVTGEKP
jgi:hypothetical protein